MQLSDLIEKFRHTRDGQGRAIFSTIFIAGNRLQTSFDRADGQVTMKQFMLLTMLRQSGEDMTFTQLGELLGCSRQNIKKLAASLEKKGLVTISRNPRDGRACVISPTEKLAAYFRQAAQIHTEKLRDLFSVYSDGEMEQLFRLLMKLYNGLDRLEQPGQCEQKGQNEQRKQEERG
ncbi:MarR family transcriptional regulator [Faecalicatena contorta]|uniref:MarR family transcriptional regulator n=1 Tax=Lachnoclostridium phocaeense TaxID=1871021 RepID=A0A921HZG2_9FIRM|nr:MarR family transcriptional regulator [Faecalicatena contorta]MBM6685612.1 MarR family transcriptional regulator [Faecalicatena contorta]MBM6711173.1 MarR family transcriptional regulator [Faecalicatena contorta]HIX99412.1 MarR family transcriptional regulator [Candidatus Dorea intestinigallinarum]HJF93706.1 MarR family transcriptional regulator [Lachnoclostridium phocaeense]